MLDASLVVAWCLDEAQTEATRSVREMLRSTHAHAPAIWPLEVSNALLVSERRKRITAERIRKFLSSLEDLPIRVDRDGLSYAFGSILEIARERGTSVYDASYIELALRLGFPLATLDERLATAAERSGVSLLEGSR